MSELNKWMVSRIYAAAWKRQNLEFVAEHVAGDFLGHSMTEIEGAAGLLRWATAMSHALPDGVFSIEDQIAEGDRVVTRWNARGVQTGEFAGLPPMGRMVKITGIDIFRIANGKIIEGWSAVNRLDVAPATPDKENDQ